MITYTIERALKKMGVPQNLKGHKYLKVAIETAINNPVMSENIMKLYTYIAEELADTPSRVERAIRHAIGKSWELAPPRLIDAVFGNTLSHDHRKPKNKHYIAAMAEAIKLFDGGNQSDR